MKLDREINRELNRELNREPDVKASIENLMRAY